RADSFVTNASTSAIATRIFTDRSECGSATVSWSRSRESSLSIDAQSRLVRSRISDFRSVNSLNAGKLGHRLGRKIRQQAAFDHGATSDMLQICAMMFHFPLNRE